MPENTPKSSFLSISIIVLLLLAVGILGYFYAISPTEDQITTAREDITALEGRLETVRDELGRAHQELTAARSDMDRLRQENQELRSATEESEQAVQSLNACQDELARVESELQAARQRLDKLEAEASANATETLQNELDSCREQAANATAALDEAQADIVSLRQELETMRGEMQTLRSQDAPATTAAGSADAANTADAQQLARCEEDKAVLQEQLDALRAERGDTAEQLNALRQDKQDVADQLAACQESRLAAARGQDELQSTLRDMKSEYQNLVNSLRKEIDEKSVVIEQIEDRLSINILGEILFSLGSRRLRPAGRELLADVAENLAAAPGDVVYVIGHTDTVPIAASFQDIFPSNWDLSAARAASVARYLLEKNALEPERIAVMGMAEHHPIADNETAEGRAQNRRVEILIGPALYGK